MYNELFISHTDLLLDSGQEKLHLFDDRCKITREYNYFRRSIYGGT